MWSHHVQILWMLVLCMASRDLCAADSHWAFEPVADPDAPAVKSVAQVKTSIDRFVLARLEEAGLGFSRPADKATLIRRVTFDLTGLPPTPAEVASFLADRSPHAFSRVVDRLLDSPHYGEHWGRHWLDVARYADNKGYVFFEEKTYPWAYTYRDYVIDAFNRDLPYDRFLMEQLAADQLDLGDDRRALAAMGFLTLGGRFMNNLHDLLDDRIDVTTRGLLGLTVSCARCHDHKYDPVPQTDYYSLYGIFRSSTEPLVPPEFRQPPETEDYRAFSAELKVRLEKYNTFIEGVRQKIVQQVRERIADYLMEVHILRGVPPTEEFMFVTETDDLNPFVIHRWITYLDERREHPVWTPWHRFSALPDEGFEDAAAAVLAAWSEGDSVPVNPLVLQALNRAPLTSIRDVAERYAALYREHQPADATTDEDSSCVGSPETAKALGELRQVLFGKDSPLNLPRQLKWGFLALIPDRKNQDTYKKLIKDIETWCMTGKAAPPRAMVLVDSPEPYAPRLFLRGNPNRPGQPVPRQFLGALQSDRRPFTQGSGRAELARAIVDRHNPLTARVLVNRVWGHLFGRGLVETPSDFGLRSEPPSHPLLLDHLATHFMNHGWSIKSLHRQILLSAVYQQGSAVRQDAAAEDPENRLLWRANRRRLSFESMRDNLLAVSGSLDRTVGGAPVNILGKEFSGRRTVYGFIDRMDLPGLYRSFDFPDPASTCPKRDRTTIAPQALYLMNHPFVAQCAGRLVDHLGLAGAGPLTDRIERVYRQMFGRASTAQEVGLAGEFLGDGADRKAWVQYVHGLMMLNEFVFVD